MQNQLWRRGLLAMLLAAGLSVGALSVAAQEATENATPAGAGPTTSEETTVGEAGTGRAEAAEGGAETGEESAEGEASPGETSEGGETVVAEGENNEAAEFVAEAEASSNPLVPLGINLGFLCFQTINFLLIFGVLTALVWRPLMNQLDKRATTIQQGLEDAAQAANARRNAEAEAERITAAARGDVNRVIEEGRTRAEEVTRQLQSEAQAEAERIRAEARAQGEAERTRQLGELRGQVGAIAVAVSQRLIGASLDQKRQQQLISDFFAKVPADAKNIGAAGNVEVVSAMPLSQDEEQRVRQEIGAQNGNVRFVTDPAILGGLIIRSNERVIDGSVRSDLDRLSTQLR